MRHPSLLLPVLLLACAPATSSSTNPPAVEPEPLPFAPAGPDAAPDPSTMGPYPVGVRTITLYDDTRQTPGRMGPRTLHIEIWYPARESTRGMAQEEYVLHEYLPDEMKADIPPEALGTLVTDTVRDAPARADGHRYPLIVFSHGKGGIRMQSTFYTVALASHGYVVVSPDHEADTLPDLLREGDLNPNSTLDSFVDRPLDVMLLIDHFTRLPEDDPLHGIIDEERIGVTGHSFGALTSLRVAGLDPRVGAVVAQTPAGYTITQADVPTRLEDYGIPVMLQAANMDRTLPADPHATSVYEHLSAPRYLLRLATAGHFTYSDLCIFDVAAIDAAIELDVSNVLTDGCGEENIQPEVALPVIRHYSIGLFNAYLRNSPGTRALLTQADGVRLAGNDVDFQKEE